MQEKRIKSANFCFVAVLNNSTEEINKKVMGECLDFAQELIAPLLDDPKNIMRVEFHHCHNSDGFIIFPKLSYYVKLKKFSRTNLGKGFKNIVNKHNNKCRVLLHSYDTYRKTFDVTNSKFTPKEF